MKELYKNGTVSATPDGKALEEQPQWRQDFPIDLPQDHYIARRDFTKFMVLISFSFVVGQFWIVFKNYLRKQQHKLPTQKITSIDQIPIGSTQIFTYPTISDPCILIRTEEKQFFAYSQKCTHLSCSVIPDPRAGIINCPCHNGSFDLVTGRPLAGPPRRSLTRIRLESRDGIIYATGFELEVA